MTPTEILDEATEAFRAAGEAVWERHGRKDIGTCGFFMIVLDGRSAVAKAALASGRGHKSDGGISFHGTNFSSQSLDLWDAARRAAAAVFEKHGVRMTKNYSWVD